MGVLVQVGKEQGRDATRRAAVVGPATYQICSDATLATVFFVRSPPQTDKLPAVCKILQHKVAAVFDWLKDWSR